MSIFSKRVDQIYNGTLQRNPSSRRSESPGKVYSRPGTDVIRRRVYTDDLIVPLVRSHPSHIFIPHSIRGEIN